MIKLLLSFFSILPLRVNHWIGRLIGQYLYISHSNSRSVVSKNIQTCFKDLDSKSQQDLIKKSLIETGKGLSESGFIWLNDFHHNAKYIKKIKGLDLLEEPTPTILLVPHFGCWEITGRVLSLTKPVVFLYKPLKNSAQEDYLISMREQGDLSMATADKKGVIKLQRALNQSKLIGILPDQDPGEEGSVLSPFFATQARSMTLLVKLARKNNARVLLTWATRLNRGKGYELNLKPVNVLSKSGKLEDDVALMNKAIEALVMTQPEQYLWNYKRFKSVVDY